MPIEVEFSAEQPFEVEFDAENQFEVEFGNVVELHADYGDLVNKPTITETDFHTVTIEGDKTFADYGMRALDALDILAVLT